MYVCKAWNGQEYCMEGAYTVDVAWQVSDKLA